MEFLKAFVAMLLFVIFMIIALPESYSISNDAQCICLAIVAAGALAHTEK